MPISLVKTLLNDLLIGLSLLTRLPLPTPDWSGDNPAARAAWSYPLAGALIALPAMAVTGCLHWLGCPPSVTALAFLIGLVMASGGMHEDGLADCADGFWGGWEQERRLEIMKDSAIGTYGVLALILVTAVKWASLSVIVSADIPLWYLAIPPVMSRAAMVVTMYALPHARSDGLSVKTGRPGLPATLTALGIAACASLLAPHTLVPILLAGLAAGALVAVLARKKIGGQTGDVLGATQSISEAAILATLATFAA